VAPPRRRAESYCARGRALSEHSVEGLWLVYVAATEVALFDPGIRGYESEPLVAWPLDEFFPRVNYITHLDRFLELFYQAWGGWAVHLGAAGPSGQTVGSG
jgi:hypothetical protein